MKNNIMKKKVKYLSVEVKARVDKIFNFIISTGLENIFEFTKKTEVEDGISSTASNLKQEVVINFFPHIEKFRNNVGKIEYLMTELEIPVQTLSNKNQKSTLTGIKDYLGSANGRHLFLSECIDISSNILAETRSIYNNLSLSPNKNSNTKNRNDGKQNDRSKLRRLLSIKHDLSVWKFILHVLSLINLASASFTHFVDKNIKILDEDYTNNSDREDDNGDKKSKLLMRGKEKVTYCQCKLLFLNVNAIKATKYFQTFETDDEHNKDIIVSEVKECKEEDENLLSPIEFFIKENDNNNYDKPTIPSIFANYFFQSTGRNNDKNYSNSKLQLGQTNDVFYSTTTNKNYSKTIKSNYDQQTSFNGSDDSYSSYDEADVNNSNLHNFNVVALSDDEDEIEQRI
jgi:hypothetical protein